MRTALSSLCPHCGRWKSPTASACQPCYVARLPPKVKSPCACGRPKSATSRRCQRCENGRRGNARREDGVEARLAGATLREAARAMGTSAERARQVLARRYRDCDYMLGVYVGPER
jgi:NMD protein affecting ribosome stability and mRNA decay